MVGRLNEGKGSANHSAEYKKRNMQLFQEALLGSKKVKEVKELGAKTAEMHKKYFSVYPVVTEDGVSFTYDPNMKKDVGRRRTHLLEERATQLQPDQFVDFVDYLNSTEDVGTLNKLLGVFGHQRGKRVTDLLKVYADKKMGKDASNKMKQEAVADLMLDIFAKKEDIPSVGKNINKILTYVANVGKYADQEKKISVKMEDPVSLLRNQVLLKINRMK